jgi:hypothetical protein
MIEEKFTPSYFEINYHIADYKPYHKTYKNVVFRNEDSSGECQVLKDKCLRACFTHFLGVDLTGTKSIKQHFTRDGSLIRLLITRCCCSQFEETHITHAVVTHISTNISFIVGKDCFCRIFSQAEDVETFWKEECKYCNKIVAKRADNRPNLCNQKCVKAYEEQERCKRNAEYEKKEREEREKNMYGNYVPQPKKVWAKKVYLKCKICDKPKKTESQQKWNLCYDCYNDEDEREIYGY